MDLSKLNREQRIAAETIEGPVLILAGAGSGKTRALTYRVANLIDHGVPAWRILALTFTNKAAKEMKNRVADLIGFEAADEAWISTFHSTCARILRRDIEKIGYSRSFVIYDDDGNPVYGEYTEGFSSHNWNLTPYDSSLQTNAALPKVDTRARTARTWAKIRTRYGRSTHEEP